ncbi:unnamed protein product [Amoebophrya sp. A25]|nr:unnamed protein product [Amoebophrya sp. A25]|eukprot:GSA25T00013487001.1
MSSPMRHLSPTGGEDPPAMMKSLYSPSPKTSKTELCARVQELQEENDHLRDMLHKWRDWYERHYKQQILYFDRKIQELSDPAKLEQASLSPIRTKMPSFPEAPPLPVIGSPSHDEMKRIYDKKRRDKYGDKTTVTYRREQIFDEFLQRQTTSSYENARSAALANRAYVESRSTTSTAFGGVSKEFRMRLRRGYGSVRKGWIEAIDKNGRGYLGFSEFCNAARTIGADTNMRHLWQELEKDGHVSLAEVDPKGHAVTKDLKYFMIDTYGSILRAWNDFVDPEKKDHLRMAVFISRCAELGWNGDAKKVFEHVNTNGVEVIGSSSGYITLKDFCEESALARSRGAKDSWAGVETPHKKKKGTSPTASPMSTQQSWASGGKLSTTGGKSHPSGAKSPMMTTAASGFSAITAPPLPDEAVTDYSNLPDPNYTTCRVTMAFLGTLKRKFATTRDAWYKALDPKGKGMLTYDEFADACKKRLQYYGSVDKVFKTLDYQGSGMVAMSDFNPRAHECLRDVQFQLLQRFGNLLDAFHPYHIGTSNEVDHDAFARMLLPFNFKPYDIQNVFDWLDSKNKKRIRGTAIEFARVGNPSKLTTFSRNSAERQQDEIHMRWESDNLRENPQDERKFTVTKKGEMTEEDARALADGETPKSFSEVTDPGTTKELGINPGGHSSRRESRRKSGSPPGSPGSGNASAKALGSPAAPGSPAAASAEPRPASSHSVVASAVGDQAPESPAASAAAEFSLPERTTRVQFGKKPFPPTYSPDCINILTVAREKHGSLKKAWSAAFAPNGEHSIDFVQFCRALRGLEYEGNLKSTWDSLGQAAENMSLTINDLDPETESRWRLWKDRFAEAGDKSNNSFEKVWRKRGLYLGVSCHDLIKWLCEDNVMTNAEAEGICEWLDQQGDLQDRNFLHVHEVDPKLGRMLVNPQ